MTLSPSFGQSVFHHSSLGKTLAVVVTYHIGESIKDTLKSIKQQVDGIIIVDNGSSEETLAILRSITSDEPDTYHLIERTENNLAAAQNMGIAAAKEAGAAWVVLSDHDSIFDPDMVANLAKVFQSLADTKIALLAPSFHDRHSERGPRYLRTWGKWLFKWGGFGDQPYLDDVMCAIASGSLISMKALDDVGNMDESYAIDDVDREFSLRLITKGYEIVAVKNALLYHQIGHCKDHNVMGMRVTTSNHCADRRYTIYRNRIRNWKRYGKQLPGFVLFDMLAIGIDKMRILICEKHKLAKYRAILRGILDGLKSKS